MNDPVLVITDIVMVHSLKIKQSHDITQTTVITGIRPFRMHDFR